MAGALSRFGRLTPEIGVWHPYGKRMARVWRLKRSEMNAKAAGAVIGSFVQLVKEGELRLHALAPKLLDGATLEKRGVAKGEKACALDPIT